MFDLPRRAVIKVAFHLLEQRDAPSSEEGKTQSTLIYHNPLRPPQSTSIHLAIDTHGVGIPPITMEFHSFDHMVTRLQPLDGVLPPSSGPAALTRYWHRACERYGHVRDRGSI